MKMNETEKKDIQFTLEMWSRLRYDNQRSYHYGKGLCDEVMWKDQYIVEKCLELGFMEVVDMRKNLPGYIMITDKGRKFINMEDHEQRMRDMSHPEWCVMFMFFDGDSWNPNYKIHDSLSIWHIIERLGDPGSSKNASRKNLLYICRFLKRKGYVNIKKDEIYITNLGKGHLSAINKRERESLKRLENKEKEGKEQ